MANALMTATQVFVTLLLAITFSAGGYLFGSIAGFSWGAMAVVLCIGLVVAVAQWLFQEGILGFFRGMNWAWHRGTDRAALPPKASPAEANEANEANIWWQRITYCLYALGALGFVSGYLNPFGVGE